MKVCVIRRQRWADFLKGRSQFVFRVRGGLVRILSSAWAIIRFRSAVLLVYQAHRALFV